MKCLFLLLLTVLTCLGQSVTSTSPPLYFTVAGSGDGTTDTRAAIQSALDAASTAATAVGGRATVMLARGKKYRLVPTSLTSTAPSAETKYVCLQMPPYVDFDLNGSVLEAYHVQGGDTTIGAVIVPKSLNTATSNYGAASNWSVGNGRIQVFDQLANRTGNVMVFARCENVRWHNLTLSGSLNHAFEIQSGRGLLVENVTCEVQTHTGSSPRFQFDHNGDAGTAKNNNFTPTAPIEDVVWRRVKLSGFPTYSASYVRCIEFGHSNAGVQRNILFEDCEFDGIRGPTSGAVASDRHILDFYTHNSSGYQWLENITVRRCKFNHDVAGGSDSACIALMSGGFSKANNILIEDCVFTGTFVHGIICGSANGASPRDRHPELRRGITIRNNTFKMGTWSSQESGGTYGPQTGGVETGGALSAAIVAGSCADVLIEGNKVIFPNAFYAGGGGSTYLNSRVYRGFHIANNYSTILKKNRCEFWKPYSGSAPTYDKFTGLSADCDEIINTLAHPCHYVCDGLEMDTRSIGASASTADVFTTVGPNWLVDGDYVRVWFGSGAITGETGTGGGVSYVVNTATATTFKLTGCDVTSTIGNCIVKLSNNRGLGYSEEPITAGVAAENRLSGYRHGIAAYVTNYNGTETVLNMPLGNKQSTPATLNATGTLALNDLLSGIITSTTAAAVVGTTRTGTQLTAELINVAIGGSHDFTVINTGANTWTLAAGSSVSIVGNAVVAATSSGQFRAKRSADTTWIIYRMN